MTELTQLTAGTRASQMALFQTNKVITRLMDIHPELVIKQKHISTKGDVDQTPIPLDTVGKAWFTKEIEEALLDRKIDFAVHSLKDVPPELPPGLIVIPILQRDDPRDGLVSTVAVTLETLPVGAVIGTDSLRRKALLLHARPDLHVKSIRGNANTRLQKLESGEYDALVMAVAGLERINRAEMITERLDPTTFVPSIGQGALAIEVRSERQDLLDLFKALQDAQTQIATESEHVFAQVIGGGCKLPVACYVHIDKDIAHVYGMVGSMDANQCVIKSVQGSATDVSRLAQQLARDLATQPFVADYVNV